ncbi:MAG TPA: demethoxyubiquinone hydroxylase family protein [Moraxellaceae bacterium]
MTVALEVERILRVDHAGERGAISIYKAQIALSRFLWPACVPALQEMLSHEQSHFATFTAELTRRNARSCHALPLWNIGGLVLGVLTALLGPKAIWSCTAAVESTVYKHLQEQIAFLQQHDQAALQAVLAIEQDEKSHLSHALAEGGAAEGANRLIWAVVSSATFIAIWLSRRL